MSDSCTTSHRKAFVQPPTDSASLALMPVAAILAIVALISFFRAAAMVYSACTFVRVEGKVQSEPTSLKSKKFKVAVAVTVITVVLYGLVVARIDNSNIEVFDPYEVLGVALDANTTVVKKAYKKLSLKHHPDKGGDAKTFQVRGGIAEMNRLDRETGKLND